MTRPDPADFPATITVSAARRWLAYGALMVLGALLLYTALAGATGFGASVVLLAFGIGFLALGEKLRRATALVLYLTDDALIDSAGVRLAAMNDIVRVNRGALAFKPTHGFTLILRDRQPAAWRPGLWWRFGRRVGVGGVTQTGAAKFMAEQISLRLENG